MSAPTQSQIARRLGVSRSTVAAALNPTSAVKLSAATRRNVLREAGRVHYRPDRYAQIMRTGRSGLIGLFQFGATYQVATERAWHASRAIEAAGYGIVVNDASWTEEGAKNGCEAMIDARAEGVIVMGLRNPAESAHLNLLRTAKIPIVTLSGNRFPESPLIRADARDAIGRMTRHLIGLGHRHLLLLFSLGFAGHSRKPFWAGHERLAGFTAAISKCGGSMVPAFSAPGKSRIEGIADDHEMPPDRFDPFRQGHDAMARILRAPIIPDAVICANDYWAIGAMSACRRAGLRVPTDIAITGFDNTSSGEYLDVPLTTVAQPNEAMAQRAAEILIAMIRQPRTTKPPGVVKFPCDLVIRQSCGSPGASPAPARGRKTRH